MVVSNSKIKLESTKQLEINVKDQNGTVYQFEENKNNAGCSKELPQEK